MQETSEYTRARMRYRKCSSRTSNTLLLRFGETLSSMNPILSKPGIFHKIGMESISKIFTCRSEFYVPSTNIDAIISCDWTLLTSQSPVEGGKTFRS
ncbi:hypothetical protein TNCV_3762991 [Trichonephila clavipes]|uniref:Uncharacterized protein n=1 Tax=Trichonephila clavipes TaxID=2585209 RepID=A0A8X7B9H6_TRICX|nr:hypothetical protein TNCV_3762991 [Trichonephila clavipes]